MPDPSGKEPILDFIRFHIREEWDRLAAEFSSLDNSAFVFQAMPNVHSIGWHVRHVIEWRYALVHVLICGKQNEENLTCLGWEKEPLIQAITSIRHWHEPAYTVAESLRFARSVRDTTDADLLALPVARHWDTVVFPWRTNRLLDEIFQDTRHSALHRGHIREIKKEYGRRIAANRGSSNPDLTNIGAGVANIDGVLSRIGNTTDAQ